MVPLGQARQFRSGYVEQAVSEGCLTELRGFLSPPPPGKIFTNLQGVLYLPI